MKKQILLLVPILTVGCGIKGKPQPPLTPPPIGRGEPNFSKATEKIKINKKIKKQTNPTDEDWTESEDFSPEEDN